MGDGDPSSSSGSPSTTTIVIVAVLVLLLVGLLLLLYKRNKDYAAARAPRADWRGPIGEAPGGGGGGAGAGAGGYGDNEGDAFVQQNPAFHLATTRQDQDRNPANVNTVGRDAGNLDARTTQGDYTEPCGKQMIEYDAANAAKGMDDVDGYRIDAINGDGADGADGAVLGYDRSGARATIKAPIIYAEYAPGMDTGAAAYAPVGEDEAVRECARGDVPGGRPCTRNVSTCSGAARFCAKHMCKHIGCFNTKSSTAVTCDAHAGGSGVGGGGVVTGTISRGGRKQSVYDGFEESDL
jgi:hypothetical protein